MKPLLTCLAFFALTATAVGAKDAEKKINPNERAELTLKAPDTLKVKQTSEISFAIKPEKGWKVSLEAPLSVKLSNAGKVVIAKRKLGVKDGAKDGKGFILKTSIEGASAGADTLKALSLIHI